MRKQWVTGIIVLGLALFMGVSPASAQLPANLLQLLQQLQIQLSPSPPPPSGCKQEISLTPILAPLGAAQAGYNAQAQKRHQITLTSNTQKFEIDALAGKLVPYMVMITSKNDPSLSLQFVGGLFTNQFGTGEFDVDGRPQKPLFISEVCDVKQVLVLSMSGKPVFFGDFTNPLNNNDEAQNEINNRQLEMQNELQLELNNINDN